MHNSLHLIAGIKQSLLTQLTIDILNARLIFFVFIYDIVGVSDRIASCVRTVSEWCVVRDLERIGCGMV